MPTTISELKQRQDTKDAASAKLGESHEVTGNTWEVSIPRTRICTLEQLIEHCQIDLSIWAIKRFVANKYEMGAKDSKTDKLVVQPLFQIKAFLERKVELSDARNEIEELKKLATSAIRAKWPTIPKPVESGNLLEVIMPDVHFGKLAWSLETGGPNYDTKIAVETYWRAFNALLSRVSHLKFERVLFILGNDCLNADDSEGRTTAGTYVSTDVRYHKTFTIVRDLKIESIQRLRKIAPVDVLVTRGNHDELSSWHLGDSLEMFFHSCPDVKIDNRPRARKYYKWGYCLLMSTHGNRGKLTDLPLLMAREAGQWWGETKFREAHSGHKHKKFVDELHGVRVRILSALCPADAWHADSTFVGNLRSAEAFVWNKDEGIIATAEFTDFEPIEAM